MCRTETERPEGSSWHVGRQIGVLTDLKARGVLDILITCTDNLNGFTDTIRTVFPQSSTQVCVVHQIRNSCKYVVYKDKKEFTADMKNIYNAPNKEVAATELDNLERKWGSKYPYAIRSWRNNWDDLTVFFQFPLEIRKIIYTTTLLSGEILPQRKLPRTLTLWNISSEVGLIKYIFDVASFEEDLTNRI